MKNYITLCLLALSLCSLSSCCSKKETANQIKQPLTENFEILINDSNINILEEKSIIIDAEEKLKEFYEGLNATRSPGFEIPKVDFDIQSVIVVAMGQQNTGGYRISSPSYNLEQGTYDFSYLSPSPNAPVTMSITTPGTVVLVNQKAGDISVRVNKK
jgi:site-specific DNA-adenine methylase